MKDKISKDITLNKIRKSQTLEFSEIANLLPIKPPNRLPIEIIKPTFQSSIPSYSKTINETKDIIKQSADFIALAFIKSYPKCNVRVNNIKEAVSKTIIPAQIPMKKNSR